MKILIKYFLIIVFFTNFNASAQKDSINKKKLRNYIIINTLGYSTVNILLYNAWYKDYDKVKFHSFDDSKEWLYMDKFGHSFTAYYLTNIQYNWLKNVGVSNKKSLLYGSIVGFTFISTVEIFDGFSEHWGASPTDIAANLSGVGIFAIQQLIWKQQKIIPKFSFHFTNYPNYRPEILGENKWQQILKDYNGQTYWLSFNIQSLLNTDFPKWLNLSIGYGAEAMIGGSCNPKEIEQKYPDENWQRASQFYLSLDVDLRKIKTRKKWIRKTLNTLNVLKIPMPTVEFYSGKTKFYFFYW